MAIDLVRGSYCQALGRLTSLNLGVNLLAREHGDVESSIDSVYMGPNIV